VPDERLSEERLSEIEKRCAAATPGPWLVFCTPAAGETSFVVAEHVAAGVCVCRDYWPPGYDPPADAHGYFVDDPRSGLPEYKAGQAAFIAHARRDVPDLVAEVRRLRAVERELRGHVRALVGRVESLAEGGTQVRPECHAADVPEVDDDGPAI
jgi:hypothetical protein